MGVFDRFKKSNKQSMQNNKQEVEELPFDVEYGSTANGNLKVDFYDKHADFKDFYDSTRLIVDRQPLDIEGHKVYKCDVSWYGSSDCEMLDEKTGQYVNLNAEDYRTVLAEIDLGLLQSDPNYCNVVMKKLLNRQRVEKYLEAGLQETPNQPCGNYIGGVIHTENGYSKSFNPLIGKVSHNSELMIKKRQEHRKMIEDKKQQAILDKQAQIEKLQSELESMRK